MPTDEKRQYAMKQRNFQASYFSHKNVLACFLKMVSLAVFLIRRKDGRSKAQMLLKQNQMQ